MPEPLVRIFRAQVDPVHTWEAPSRRRADSTAGSGEADQKAFARPASGPFGARRHRVNQPCVTTTPPDGSMSEVTNVEASS
jgi:hypothetical protein